LIQLSSLAGISLATAGLMAACGADDEDPTATGAAGSTATADSAEPTTTSEPTEAMEEPTATAEAGGGENPRHMGLAIEPPQSEGGILIEGRVTDLSAVYLILGSFAYPEVFEGLVELHPTTFEPHGNLAVAWEASEDAATWTISLRDGVTFHDGEPFTAEDVKASYEFHKAAGYDRVVGLETVDVVDDSTVQFNLSGPSGDVPVELSLPVIGAAHIVSELDPLTIESSDAPPATTGEDSSQVIGTGPFRFMEFVAGDHVTLERYDDYWDGRPILDQIIIKAVESTSAVAPLLRTGEIDFTGGDEFFSYSVDAASVPELEANGVIVENYPSGAIDYVAFNLDPEKSSFFQDLGVRQALAHAIDYQAMLEAVRFGYADPPIGFIQKLAGVPTDGVDVRYDYDPDKAAQLLEDAGWVLDGEYRAKDGQQLAFVLYVEAGDIAFENYASIIQEYWRAVGVDVTVQVEESTVFWDRYAAFDFDTLGSWFSYGTSVDYIWLWDCESFPDGGNRFKYCNPEVDALMAEIKATPERETRLGLLVELENVVMEDLPMVILGFPRGIGARTTRVHNLYLNALNTRFNAETWWVDG
jgi:peptide/nickel transport system substrate-binding protein